jgi:hypothetical protein
MAVMARDAWTDNRLDDLNERVGRLEGRVDTGFAEMRQEFRALRSDLTHLTYSLIGAMLVGFLGTIVTIITQT